MVDEDLSLAVVHFIGAPGRVSDVAPSARVLNALGERGRHLLPRVEAILADVYAADPPLWKSRSIPEMGDRVLAWLSVRYPQLSGDAVRAITNQFTYDWK